MKKLVASCLLLMSLVSCADNAVVCGEKAQPYGIFNDEEKLPNVKYRVVFGNVVWSILLIETLFAPLYFVGYALYEPIPKEAGCDIK
jgi:hypothetical protein